MSAFTCVCVMAMQLTHKKYVNFQFSYVINGLHLKYIKYKFISCENSPILHTILPCLHVCPRFKRLDACVLFSSQLNRVYRYRHKIVHISCAFTCINTKCLLNYFVLMKMLAFVAAAALVVFVCAVAVVACIMHAREPLCRPLCLF